MSIIEAKKHVEFLENEVYKRKLTSMENELVVSSFLYGIEEGKRKLLKMATKNLEQVGIK